MNMVSNDTSIRGHRHHHDGQREYLHTFDRDKDKDKAGLICFCTRRAKSKHTTLHARSLVSSVTRSTSTECSISLVSIHSMRSEALRNSPTK